MDNTDTVVADPVITETFPTTARIAQRVEETVWRREWRR
jgi:hypothetical protein